MSEKSAPQPDQAPSPIGEISQEPSAFEAFLDKNQKKLVIAGILLIIALVAYVVIEGLNEQKLKTDSAEVSAARTVPELEAQAEDKAGTNAGGTALLYKARVQWQELQQNEAVATLEKFVNDYPEHPALASGLASLASYHQKLGDLDQAKSYYLKAVDQNGPVSSLALITLGDIARSEGDDEAAKAYYDRASDEYGDIHASIRGLAERHAQLLGVEAPAEAEAAPPTPAPTPVEAASKPVKVEALPAPPETPKKVEIKTPATPTPPVPTDPTPAEPTPGEATADDPKPAESPSKEDPSSN